MKKKLFFIMCLINLFINAKLFIPFLEAMQANPNFNTSLLTHPNWAIVHKLYDTYSTIPTASSPRIPRIVHHIWLGSPLPDQYKQLRETWMHHHPGWKFILWDDKAVENLDLINKNVYSLSSNFGSKADIARYEILYRFGGLYVDTDFECLNSFEELHHLFDFYSAIGYEKTPDLYNGLIGSIPGHPILKLCIDNLSQIPANPRNAMDIMHKTGPFHFSKCFFELIPGLINTPIIILPPGFVYAWPHYIKNEPNPHRWIRKETIALHHWNVSWMK